MNKLVYRSTSCKRQQLGALILATSLMLLTSQVEGLQEQIVRTQSQGSFDAVTYDQVPSFYTFNGFQSIMAPLVDTGRGELEEYTISMWMKMSEEGYDLVKQGVFSKQTVLYITDTLECHYHDLDNFMCTSLKNETQPAIKVELGEWDPRSWIHFTLSGSVSFNETYLSLQNYYDDYSNYQNYDLITYEQMYWPIDTSANDTVVDEETGMTAYVPLAAYLGNTADMNNGFSGSLREFYFNQQFTSTFASEYMKNLDKSWDLNQIGYYKLTMGSLDDYFQGMKASLMGYNVSEYNLPAASFLGIVSGNAIELVSSSEPNFDKESHYAYAETQGTAPFVVSPDSGLIQLAYIDNIENENNLVWKQSDVDRFDDKVFYYAQYQYEYLFSAWIWLDEGIAYTSDEKDGRDDYYLFKLDEAFTIYFTSENTIKIYFVTFSNYVDQVSEEIYLPTRQWANLQFTIKQYGGYEVMVFDEYGQIRIHIQDDQYLYDMRPTGYFYMFKNFKGYVKDLVVFQGDENTNLLNVTLPYTSPLSGTEVVYDDLMFIYYDFQVENFNFTSSTFSSLTYNSDQGIGQDVYFMGNSFAFDYLTFNTQLNYSDMPSLAENVTDFSILYIDDPTFYYDEQASALDGREVLQLGGSDNAGIYQEFTFDSEMAEVDTISVEFWFKRIVNTDASAALFSIEQYSASEPDVLQDTFMQLLKTTASDYELICIPIVSQVGSFTGEAVLSYTETEFDSTDFNFDWQHVSCQYEAGTKVTGVYYSDELSDMEYLRQRVYTQDITSDGMVAIQNNVNDTFMFTLGMNSGDQTLFKELRLFTTSRSVYDVQRDRFVQLNTADYGNHLPIYNRLVALSDKIYKQDNPMVYADDFYQLTDFTYVSDSDNLVCPQYFTKSMDAEDGSDICLSNPFQQQLVHFIAQEEIQVVNGLEETVFKYYLTNQYSDMYNNKLGVQGINFMQNKWMATDNSDFDANIIAPSQEGVDQTYTLSFEDQGTQIYNDQEIAIRLESSGDEYYTFVDYVSQTIIPQDCRWLGGVDYPYSAFQDQVYSINDIGVNGIDLIFQVHERSQTFLTCEDITPYNILNTNKIQVNVTPSMPFAQTDLANVVQLKQLTTNDDGMHVINMVIPKSYQEYFPIDEWVNIVMTMQWEKDESNAYYTDLPDLRPYLSVAFRVKFQQDFSSEIAIESGSSEVEKDQDLVLSRSIDYDWGYESDVLISKWSCPNFLQSVCETKDLYADTLTITYDEFYGQTLKLYGEDYTFDLFTWMQTDFDDSAKIKSSVTVQWIEDPAPEFYISVPFNQGKVLSTKKNEFKINLVNYRVSDVDLVYEWQFIDEATNLQESQNNVIFSSDQSIAETGIDYFETQKSYIVQVTIYLASDPTLTTTESISFTTSSPPIDGEVSVTPSTGQALNTLFTMSIFNWTPFEEANGPVTFKLYANQDGSSELISLSPFTYTQDETVEMQLSTVSQIVFEISDSSLEQVQVTYEVTVTDPNTLDTEEIDSLVIDAQSQFDTEQQYSTYETIAEEINYQYDQGDTENSQGNKIVLLDYMQSDLDIISEFSEEEQQIIVADQTSILSLITEETTDINEEIMESSLDIISSFMEDESLNSAYMTAIQDENTFQDLLTTVSNLQLSNIESLIEIQPDYVSGTSNEETPQQVGQSLWESISQAHRVYQEEEEEQGHGRRLQVVYDNVGYDLESVSDMTELKQQLSILKEEALDDYCMAIQQNNIEYIFDSELYELTVENIDVSTQLFAKQYVYSHDLTTYVFPLEGLSLVEAQTGATELCVRVNFWKENPLEGISSSRFSQISGVAVQLTTVDDNGEHLLRKAPIDYPDNFDTSNEFTEIVFPMQFSSLNGTRFFANQSMCHYHPPVENISPDQFGEYQEDWQMSKCETTYFYNNNTILCQCQGLNEYYFAIVNDFDRIWSEQETLIEVDLDVQFDDIVWVIIIVNCLALYCMQFIGFILDGRDISKLDQLDTYGVSNDFLQLYTDKYNAVHRKDQRNFQEMSYHESIYRSKRLAEFKTVETITCGQAYNILVRQTHPFFEIFYRYDFFLKRIYRIMILELQLCLITWLILNIYNDEYRTDASYSVLIRDELDDTDRENIRQNGLILAILTLPLPMWLSKHLYMKIIVDQTIKNKKKQISIEQAKRQGVGEMDRGIGKKSNQTPGGPNANDMYDMEADSDILIVTDKMLAIKLICCLLTNLVICPLTIYTLVDRTSNYTTVQTQCIVYTYIFAVVVGWFIYNPLKCALQAYVTSFKVFNKEAVGMCTNLFALFFCTTFSLELFNDIEIVDQVHRELQKLKKDEEEEQDHNMLMNFNANFDYKKDKEHLKKQLMENNGMDLSNNSGAVHGEVVDSRTSKSNHYSHKNKYDDEDNLDGFDNDLQKQMEDDVVEDHYQSKKSKKSKKHKKHHKEEDYGDDGEDQYADYDKQIQQDQEQDEDYDNEQPQKKSSKKDKKHKKKSKKSKRNDDDDDDEQY